MLCLTPDFTQIGAQFRDEDGRVSTDDVVFYIGFKLDGVQEYTNISESAGLENLGRLTVFAEPKLYRANGTITYQHNVPLNVKVWLEKHDLMKHVHYTIVSRT